MREMLVKRRQVWVEQRVLSPFAEKPLANFKQERAVGKEIPSCL
jgi:hypothetical protein